MNIRPIVFGFLLLLVSSVLDNVRPPIVPKLISAYSLSYQMGGLFFAVGSIAAILVNFVLKGSLGKLTLTQLAKALLILASAVCFGANWVSDQVSLLTFGFGLGAAMAGMGSLCNLFIIRESPPAYRTRLLCLLHCMYGFGSLFSPLLAKWLYDGNYSLMSPFYVLGVCSILVFLFPVPPLSAEKEKKSKLETLDWVQGVIVATFALYVVGEILLLSWLPTYLVNLGVPFDKASYTLALAFGMMGLSRLICFMGLKPALEKTVIVGCLLLSATFFVLGHQGFVWAFIFCGLFGPFFPAFLSYVNHRFPEAGTQLTLTIFIGDQVALAVGQWVLGRAADHFGVGVAYWLPLPCLLLASLASAILFYWGEKEYRPA